MTKTQIWSSVFLGLFILLFLLHSATKDEAGISGAGYTEEPVAESESAAEISGAELVSDLGCMTCHGGDLKGSNLAPTLYGLSSYYDRDQLINYLRNPNSFMDRDRFKAYKEKYRNIVMPSYNNRDVKELGRMADYLLGL